MPGFGSPSGPHTWRLAYYEADGTSPVLDAAIYQRNTEWEMEQDLTFVSPLYPWLLLLMVIDGETVSAHFFGRSPGVARRALSGQDQ